MFNEGQRPAVNVGLSVSRVGGAAQNPVMKKISASLRTRLAQYREPAEFMQFGSDIDDTTKATLESGKRLTEALKQARFSPVADELQSILIYAVSEGYAKHIDVADIEGFERELYRFFETEKAPLLLQVKKARKLDDALKREIDAALAEFVERF